MLHPTVLCFSKMTSKIWEWRVCDDPIEQLWDQLGRDVCVRVNTALADWSQMLAEEKDPKLQLCLNKLLTLCVILPHTTETPVYYINALLYCQYVLLPQTLVIQSIGESAVWH